MTTARVGVALALVPAWAWAQTPLETDRYFGGPHTMWWAAGWPGMFFGPLMMILMFAAIIACAVLLVRWVGGPGHGHGAPPHHPPSGRAPLDFLKERFARGDIDKDEFEARRRVLGD